MIAKKFFIYAIICICFYANALGQSTSDTLTPKAGEKQITFGISNNTGLLVYRKHKTEKSAIRLLISGSYQYQNDPVSYSYSMYKSHRSNLNIGYGFQRRIGTFKKLEPYAGVDFVLQISTGMTESKDESYYTTYRKVKEGITLGANIVPFIGFNYYITDRLALGAEYSVSIINARWNNKHSSSTTTIDNNGNILSYNTFSTSSKNSFGVDGHFNGYAAITASFFLNKNK